MNNLLTTAVLLLCLSTLTVAAAEPAGFDQSVLPFFSKYCLRCHDGAKQEGEFRLDVLSREFADQATAERWGEVMFRMNSGEMPPKKESHPQPDELGQVVQWISSRVKEGEAVRMAKRGPVAHYRLSREKYGHTVYDLLGVRFDVNMPGAFNEDPRWHGFDRIGAMLSLSPSHIDRYLRAAETVLERAFPVQSPQTVKRRADAIEMRHCGERQRLEEFGIAEKMRATVWPGGSLPGFRGYWFGQVNDWELASRLSYFLWSSMPDDELLAAAQLGTLRQSDVLRTQLTHMLADEKISRFTESFPQQLNLTWAPDWKNGQFHVADIWLDEESRDVASELQRQVHIRHVRHRWLPGWIDHVEHEPGGKGIVTLTLFGGMDPTLYDQARAQAKPGGGASIASAEWTLRSWWQEHDSKNGPVLDFKEIPDPRPGSSGLQL